MRAFIAVAFLALATAVGASAQERPPIRAFDLPTIEALGAAIYRQDSAAWVATDTLMSKVRDPRGQGLIGWIVVDAAPNQKVRFLRAREGRLEAGYDIVVTPELKTTLVEPVDRALSTEEVAMFTARQTATAGLAGAPLCRPNYNVAVLKDPERAGWLVWLLAPLPAANQWAIGGHYRFSVSADGRTVPQRDALSASCMIMNSGAINIPKGSRPGAYVVTHLVSPTPVETHVFVNLQSRMPIGVGAGDHMWMIEQGRITDFGIIGATKK
jgi:hypothetical protein